jgi:DNA-binding FadR family transcriptional regulator
MSASRPAAHPAVFSSEAKTRAIKTSENVARAIVHTIVRDRLRHGDRLPSEAAMLGHYGVSRESLREGLRLLEVQGLISIRRGPGGGPIVGRVDSANLGRISTLFYHLAGGTYAELFESWVMTEGILAGRAARNHDRALVLEALDPYLAEDPRVGVPADMADFVRFHAHFHGVVASLADNRVLSLLLQTTGQIVTHHVVGNADPREGRDEIVRDHMDVARAIATGRPHKARTSMEEHIRHMFRYYRVGLEDYIAWR